MLRIEAPAPPIWAFAARNRFDGQDVLLFNTYNSTFEQRFIDDFRDLVLSRGARSFRHLSVKRGRMGQQISSEELLDRVDAEWYLKDVGGPRPSR